MSNTLFIELSPYQADTFEELAIICTILVKYEYR